jgi:AmiR/NasT family two-component response regulator
MARSFRVAIHSRDQNLNTQLSQLLESAGHNVTILPARSADLIASLQQCAIELLITHEIELQELDKLNLAWPVISLEDSTTSELVQSRRSHQVMARLSQPLHSADLLLAIPFAIGKFQELCDLREQLTKSETALRERKLVEKAKGLVMQSLNLSEEAAYRHLQRQARDQRKPLPEVAACIVTAVGILTG